jgi:quinol monooxygenase YgiN
MIALHAELRVGPEHHNHVLFALQALLALAAKEPDNLIYAIHRDDDRDTLVLYELYRDRAACDAHLASPAVVAALSAFSDLLLEPPRVQITELLYAHLPSSIGAQS